jgi:23S rRNA (cytosine1962-C5)-methyltransferase
VDRLVDRPHPAALGSRARPGEWRAPDLRFDRDRGWTGPAVENGAWTLDHEGLRLELRPTGAGQVGLFPEHLAVLDWLRARVRERVGQAKPPLVLHLFAYTGLATLALAGGGAAVAHVDASRPTVAWARRNADLSGLADRPIRWIVDDAVAFTEREARRGRRYAGVVLDPPSYGHGPTARPWRLENDLPRLLGAIARVVEPDAFVLLTAHTPGVDANQLERWLSDAMGRSRGGFDGGELSIATADGRRLELGVFASRSGRA